MTKDFFHTPLIQADAHAAAAIQQEWQRQHDHIELIASENYVSRAVLQAQGSVLTNKYAEGYPGRRYYGGCGPVDEMEMLAINRIKELFGCTFANVQPHSGAQANQAVFLALLNPGDTFLGMNLASGGHLTHGSPANFSGKWFKPVAYEAHPDTGFIDYDHVAAMAREHKPKLIIAGGSAYARIIDFAKFRAIADEVGAYLMVDMAHFAGLVAGGVYPNPLPYAHVVTSTTHKTLRSGRGGIILAMDEEMGKKINSAVFPGLQGGPLMHIIAGKAVGVGEALQDSFKVYAQQIVANAKAMAETLLAEGFNLVSGGTDSHLMLVDLRPKNITGDVAAKLLEDAHITCNKNGIPQDPQPPRITSGIRLGTPAGTTRGFKEQEFRQIALWINQVLSAPEEQRAETIAKVRKQVAILCKAFPVYSEEVLGESL